MRHNAVLGPQQRSSAPLDPADMSGYDSEDEKSLAKLGLEQARVSVRACGIVLLHFIHERVLQAEAAARICCQWTLTAVAC